MNESSEPFGGVPYKEFKPKFCWMSGKMIDWMDATIHLGTPFREGDTVFEGIRGYFVPEEEELYVWVLNEHLKRFFDSAKLRRMKIPYSFDEIKSALLEVIIKNEYKEDIYIQPWAFRTFKYPYYTREVMIGCWIWARPRGRLWGDKQFTGLKVGVSSWLRLPDIVAPVRAKIFANYVGNSLADMDVRALGFDVAIMLTLEGKVCEGTGENLFIVRDEKVITPTVTQGILEGITRSFILEAAHDLGYETCEREIDRSELYIADEIFLCGTGSEVVPVIEVDTYPIGDGKRGPITEKLQNIFYDTVKGKVPKYKGYLTPVYGK